MERGQGGGVHEVVAEFALAFPDVLCSSSATGPPSYDRRERGKGAYRSVPVKQGNHHSSGYQANSGSVAGQSKCLLA